MTGPRSNVEESFARLIGFRPGLVLTMTDNFIFLCIRRVLQANGRGTLEAFVTVLFGSTELPQAC